MKVERIRTLGLPSGIRVLQYDDADVTKLLQTPANLTIVTDVINKYLRQKDALVDFRDDLINTLTDDIGFKMLMEKVVEDGKEVETPAEKPGQYLDRLVAALIKGDFTHPRLPVSGKTEKEKENSAYSALQAIADTLGDTDEKGVAIKRDEKTDRLLAKGFSYRLDIARPERKPGKPPKVAELYITAATNIINGGSAAKWAERFTKGFVDAKGIKIDPIQFKDFQAVAPKGAKPEEVEAVRKANITNLAWAISDKEAQVREKTKTEKLAEFV